ncbi:hypothetical protein AB1Y20_011372 [Prymnesium parvum]|uniref:GB1/RHD3-type G domain-containing protein n=1 Tax=Prymnesium parvum TaxID=97485 RepID=A0AB34IQB0_PRYPA
MLTPHQPAPRATAHVRPHSAAQSLPPPSHPPSRGSRPHALPLVQEEEGKLRLCQPGLDALRELKQPLALVSIAGTPRCGKSFLANQLLGRMDGFRVSSAPCTRGLWLWSHPLPGLPAEAEAASLTMLLLDCEGVASDTAVSDRLFCLTAALSSAMCFNVSGAIDEEHLLHLAALLADTAPAPLDERLHGESARTNRPHSDSHIPAFVWAYLETALLTAPLHVRQQLCRQLPCRDSVILPRPVADERLLAQLHRLPPSTLRPKFNHAVTDLRHGAVVVSALCACTTYLNGCRAEPVEGESEGEEASPAASVAGAIDACAQGVAEWLGMTVVARREWAMRQNGDASKPLKSREAYMGEARRSPQPTPACEDTGCGEAETAPPTPRPASEDAAPRDRTTRRAEGNTAVEAVANCACCMDGWISACAGGRVGEASAGGAEESTAMLRRESSGGVLLLALRNDLLRLEDEAEAQRSVLHAIEERMDEERRKARREVAAHAAAREAAEAELRALKEARGNEARAHRGEAAEDVEASVARAVAQAVARKQMEIEAARETARLSLRLQIDAERQAKERDASEAQQRYDEVARQLASARRVVGEQESPQRCSGEVLLNERAKIIDELRASKSTQDAEELSVLRASRDEAVTQMMALRRSVRFALVRAALSRRSGQACLAALSHWRRSIDSLGEVMTLRGRLRLAQLLLLRRLAASDEEATLRSALHTWSSTLPRVLASRQTTAPTLGVHHLVVLTLAARARSSAARLAHALRVWAGAVTSMERAACVQLLHLAGDAVAPLPLLVRTALAKARVDDFSGAAAAQRAERSAELMRAEAELLRREAVAEMQQARALVHSVMTPYLAEQRASSHRWAALMLQSFLMSNWAAACRGALLVWRSAARRAELRPPSVDQLRWASPEDVPSDVYSDSPLGAALRAAAFAAQAMGCPLEVTLLPSDDAT